MWPRYLISLLACLCRLTVARTVHENTIGVTEVVVDGSFAGRKTSVGVIDVLAHTAKVGFDTFAWTLVPAGTLLLAIPIIIACSSASSQSADEDSDDDWKKTSQEWSRTFQTATNPSSLRSVSGRPQFKSPEPLKSKSPTFGRLSPVSLMGSAQAAAGRKDASPLQIIGGQLTPLLRHDSDDSTRTESGGSSPMDFASELVLCPGLVVQQPGGVTLKMQGLCAPYKQSEVLDVTKQEHLMARVIISEYTNGGGVVLESESHVPLVFLSTDRAVAKKGARPPADRYITVSPVSMVSANASEPTIFTVKADGANEGFVMWRGAPPGETMLLAVRVHGDGVVANVVDTDGKLLAATETRDGNGNGSQPVRLLHIASGVDAGLILVAVIAAKKLS